MADQADPGTWPRSELSPAAMLDSPRYNRDIAQAPRVEHAWNAERRIFRAWINIRISCPPTPLFLTASSTSASAKRCWR